MKKSLLVGTVSLLIGAAIGVGGTIITDKDAGLSDQDSISVTETLMSKAHALPPGTEYTIPGQLIDWEDGKGMITKYDVRQLGMAPTVYVEFDLDTTIKILHSINTLLEGMREEGLVKVDTADKVRAYFSMYTNKRKTRLYRSVVFVPTYPEIYYDSLIYTDFGIGITKQVFDVGSPYPPDCNTGRVKQTDSKTRGAIMAYEIYNNAIDCLKYPYNSSAKLRGITVGFLLLFA